jgi:hypothetical protein
MNKKGFIGAVIILLAILIIMGLFLYNVAYVLMSGIETINIKEKWIKYHNNDAKYLVSSTNGQVFQITDTWVRWRFDSSDLYSYLQPGMNCIIKTQGWRFPFFSDYKNIIEAECIQ